MNHKKIRRLMREHDPQPKIRPRFVTTTDSDHDGDRILHCSVIALWLGHESTETTQTYLHAHLALKEAALAKLKLYWSGKRTRFRPSDRLVPSLEAL